MTDELWRARHGADADAPRRVIRQPRGASMDVKLLAYEVRAARAAAAGREGDARRQAAAGLDLLSSWQNSFGSLDLQTSTSGHGNGLMLEGLASAVRSRRPDVLFEWSERARHLSQEVIPLRPPPDQGLANDLAELRMLRAENPSGDWLSDPRAAALRDRARERQWSATGSAAVQQRVDLEEFRGHLGDDTALLSFVFSGESLSCLVVIALSAPRSSTSAAGRPCAAVLAGLRADLDVSASVRSGPMASVVQRALDERLALLSSVLLSEPLRAAGGARRLILTVPGVLNGIPWAMLPAMRDRVFTRRRVGDALDELPSVGGGGRRRRRAHGRLRHRPAGRARGRGGVGRGIRLADRRPCCAAATRPSRPSPAWRRRSTCCTSPPTAVTPPTTRCSPAWNSPTARCSATTSTSCRTCPTPSCSRRARWGARRCGGARRRSG